MDPQSQAFTPYSSNNDTWRLQTDVARLQQVQVDHSDRIARLEKRQEDDARVKSVWGNSSPFPSVLSGTPQQAPLQQPPSDHFRNFDDDANNMMSSLHLDPEDEPRRGMGANSRANSVRFDETANQNHFSHSSRSSVELTGLGGLQMTERTSSHKSEGRASSQHSIRSAASGRGSSLNLDTSYSMGESSRFSLGNPGLAPGLLLLGSVPAIIRCWMNENFKHDALLYAAVCTGSYKSFLNLQLIQKLGFEDSISTDSEGRRTVELKVYFPEAVPHPASSRSSSPAPQLPEVTVDFQVVDHNTDDDKAIQIFLGSDVLRAHSADILFSSNSMTLFDDERSKLSIPLVRPESEAAFKSLFITSDTAQMRAEKADEDSKGELYLNGLDTRGSSTASVSSTGVSPPPGKYRPPGAMAPEIGSLDAAKNGATGSDRDARSPSRQSNISRPSLSLVNTRTDVQDQSAESGNQNTPLRSGSSPAIWSNWRREGSASAGIQATGMDWASASRSRDSSYQRKDTGIKVLKPKAAGRTFSSSTTGVASGPSSVDGKSRFFDEGRRRSEQESKPIGAEVKAETPVSASASNASISAPKTKSNPIGGGSAFSWLNSGGGAK